MMNDEMAGVHINGHLVPEPLLVAIEKFARARAKDWEHFLWPGGGWPLRQRADLRGVWREGKIRLFLYPIAELAGENDEVSLLCIWRYANACATSMRPEPHRVVAKCEGILCFGDFGVDSQLCLDYGQSPDDPPIIWLDNAGVWQKLAPNFESFLALFEI